MSNEPEGQSENSKGKENNPYASPAPQEDSTNQGKRVNYAIITFYAGISMIVAGAGITFLSDHSDAVYLFRHRIGAVVPIVSLAGIASVIASAVLGVKEVIELANKNPQDHRKK